MSCWCPECGGEGVPVERDERPLVSLDVADVSVTGLVIVGLVALDIALILIVVGLVRVVIGVWT